MSSITNLNNVLEQGETIIWSGIPQQYSLLGESHKKSTIISLCWALAWGIFLVGGYYALTISKGVEIQTGVMIFCAAVPLFIVWMPIADKRKVKQLSYAVTDKRAIVLSDKPISLPIADIDDLSIDKADDGNCHIRVGSSTFKTSSRKLPSLAYRGEFSGQGDDKTYKGLVFFNASAEDGKIVSNLLKPVTSPVGV